MEQLTLFDVTRKPVLPVKVCVVSKTYVRLYDKVMDCYVTYYVVGAYKPSCKLQVKDFEFPYVRRLDDHIWQWRRNRYVVFVKFVRHLLSRANAVKVVKQSSSKVEVQLQLI